MPDADRTERATPRRRDEARKHGLDVIEVSSVTGAGLVTLKRRLLALLAEARPEPVREQAL